MNVMSTRKMPAPPASRPLTQTTKNENTSKGDDFTFSGNSDSVLMKSLVGATLGGCVSAIPASALLQNGTGLGAAAVLAGGVLLGGVLLANANVEIGIAPG